MTASVHGARRNSQVGRSLSFGLILNFVPPYFRFIAFSSCQSQISRIFTLEIFAIRPLLFANLQQFARRKCGLASLLGSFDMILVWFVFNPNFRKDFPSLIFLLRIVIFTRHAHFVTLSWEHFRALRSTTSWRMFSSSHSSLSPHSRCSVAIWWVPLQTHTAKGAVGYWIPLDSCIATLWMI